MTECVTSRGGRHGGDRRERCARRRGGKAPGITHGETPLLLSALLTPAGLGRSYSMGMRNYYFKKEKRTVNFIYVFIQKLTPIQSLA